VEFAASGGEWRAALGRTLPLQFFNLVNLIASFLLEPSDQPLAIGHTGGKIVLEVAAQYSPAKCPAMPFQ
jgi:hypothetical protein